MILRGSARLALLLLAGLCAGCGGETPLPGPAGERVPAGEAEAIAEVIAGFRDKISHRDDGVSYRRGAHPKHHACVRGEFTVREDLPADLRHGVFRAGAAYPALVRFSNNADPQPDAIADVRGMAIKLFGITGETLFHDRAEDATQDFLLVSHPVFLFPDVVTYARGFRAIEAGNALLFFFNPLDSHLRSFLIARDMQVRHGDLRAIPWSSMVPYALGPDLAVKYAARSCSAAGYAPAPDDDPDFLATRLRDTLAAGAACFVFSLQRQGDPARMPLEDPTVAWSEADSPLVPVATLTLPQQELDQPGAMEHCEQLSYNPWRVLPAHRPLGGINRARRVIYEAMAAFRREHNGQSGAEPQSPVNTAR